MPARNARRAPASIAAAASPLPRAIASSSSWCSRTALWSCACAIEGDHPDAQRLRVVPLERLLEELVVARAVDRAVDPLVEVDQRAVVAPPAVELLDQRVDLLQIGSVARSAASRAASGSSTTRTSHSRARSRTSTRRDEHAAARVDLDQPLQGEPAQASRIGVRPIPSLAVSSRSPDRVARARAPARRSGSRIA